MMEPDGVATRIADWRAAYPDPLQTGRAGMAEAGLLSLGLTDTPGTKNAAEYILWKIMAIIGVLSMDCAEHAFCIMKSHAESNAMNSTAGSV